MTTPESDREIRFHEGLIGLPAARRFQLLDREGAPVRVLQCLDIPGFDLPVVDPFLADSGYKPSFRPQIRKSLRLDQDDPFLLLAIAVLQPDGPPLANLRAPLLINADERIGVQVIIENRPYSLRAPVDLDS